MHVDDVAVAVEGPLPDGVHELRPRERGAGRLGPVGLGSITFAGAERITRHLAPGFLGNAGDHRDPHLQDLQARIRRFPPLSSEAVELVKEAARYVIADQALVIPLWYNTFLWPRTDRVRGLSRLDSTGMHPVLSGVHLTEGGSR